MFFQVELDLCASPMAPTSAPGTSNKRPKLHAGGLHLSDFGGIHTLFPCAQGILEGPPAQTESLWLEYPYYVSAVSSSLHQTWLPNRACAKMFAGRKLLQEVSLHCLLRFARSIESLQLRYRSCNQVVWGWGGGGGVSVEHRGGGLFIHFVA